MNHLPNSSFLQSRPARVELARQRFFEEGQAPTGAVGEAIFESWARCLRRLGSPREQATFEPVTASRTQLALQKNRQLRQAWLDELPQLEAMLGSTSCAAMLTDASGVLIGSSCVGRPHEELMPVATRLGVNLSEDAVGTTAPGVAARTGKAVCVLGGEHYFDSVRSMHCAAAPIHDIRGQLAGVFDISSERIAFEFDAAAVAGLYAGAIENRLLIAQSTEHLVIRFQVAPELLDSALVGLIGIDSQGRRTWENRVAQSLLGDDPRQSTEQYEPAGPELAWPKLTALPLGGAAPLTLPNGLRVWARAEMRAPDGLRGPVIGVSHPSEMPTVGSKNTEATVMPVTTLPAADGPPSPDIAAAVPAHAASAAVTPRLRESDLDLIQRTLQTCGGNVSDAAERLGVSRGLIYRRLRTAGASRQVPGD